MQTSIEWLADKIDDIVPDGLRKYIEPLVLEAKEMHKIETIKFCYDFYATIEESENCIINKLPEELYQETFKKD